MQYPSTMDYKRLKDTIIDSLNRHAALKENTYELIFWTS